MPDIATIASALTSLKAATDIVKFIRESDVSLEKAEMKLKLADLVSALADAKIQLSDIQGQMADKDAEIVRLTEAFETKGNTVRLWDAIYYQNEQGEATGRPHCLSCWNDRHKLRPLAEDHSDRTTHVCTSCKHKYQRRLTPMDADYARRANS